MANPASITNAPSIATLNAARESILSASAKRNDDLSSSQEREVANLADGVAAGTAHTLADASAQLGIVSEYLDLLGDGLGDAAHWDAMRTALASAHAVVSAAA